MADNKCTMRMSAVNKEDSDKIILKGLQFYGFHGVLPEEQKQGQIFMVDLELKADLHQALLSDDLADTINYAAVFDLVKQLIEQTRYRLLEALAEAVCEAIHADFFGVQQIKITIKKPQAPLPGIFEYAAVELTRNY